MVKMKIKFIGNNTFITKIFKGNVLDGKGRGWPMKKYLEDIKDRMRFHSFMKMKRTAEIMENTCIGMALPSIHDDDFFHLPLIYIY